MIIFFAFPTITFLLIVQVSRGFVTEPLYVSPPFCIRIPPSDVDDTVFRCRGRSTLWQGKFQPNDTNEHENHPCSLVPTKAHAGLLNRRNVLTSITRHTAYPALLGMMSLLPSPSRAFEDDQEDDDQDEENDSYTPRKGKKSSYYSDDDNRVILQTDFKNLPKKYDSPSSLNSQSSAYTNSFDERSSNAREMCTDSNESRRIAVFERAAPSVVYIDTFVEQRDAFTTNVMEVPLGTGSGFVWDDKGHIVTNYHVVRNAGSAQVAILTRIFPEDKKNTNKLESNSKSLSFERQTDIGLRYPTTSPSSYHSSTTLSNGIGGSTATSYSNNNDVAQYSRKVYKARVVGVDPGKDIAVLKIDAPVFDLYPIDVGTSTGLKVGQSAYAIGNPFGLDHTLTVGVVSGIGREVRSPIGRPITNVIQTDAAINPGNSGGPLLDSSGKLIGINTSIFSPSGGSAGIGFAIPVDTVTFVVEALIKDGKVVRPVMGITYLQSSQARNLGINKGVLVLDVPLGSSAAKAGMRGTRRTESGLIEIGDIIVQIEDFKIDSETDLLTALETFQPGDVVKVTVNRPEVEGTPSTPKLKMTTKTLFVKLKASIDQTVSQFLFPPE